jgi:hypothetical protein
VLERALAILRERTQDRAEHAAAEAPLAQALWLSGHRTRALAIGRQALDGYASVPGRDRQREAVAAWLAGKR